MYKRQDLLTGFVGGVGWGTEPGETGQSDEEHPTFVDNLYYLAAVHLGWPKTVVDEQPLSYVQKMVQMFLADTKQGGGAAATTMKKVGKLM